MSVVCLKCSTSNADSAKFCKSCGNAVHSAAQEQAAKAQSSDPVMLCEKCNVANAVTAKFCKACGFSLIKVRAAETPAAQTLAAPAPSPSRPTAAKPTPMTEPAPAPDSTDPLAVKSPSTGMVSRRSSTPLYAGLGALALALLGVVFWVFTGVKSGDLAPPGSPQTASKAAAPNLKESAMPTAAPTSAAAPSSAPASAVSSALPPVVAKAGKEEVVLPSPAVKAVAPTGPIPSATPQAKPAAPLKEAKPQVAQRPTSDNPPVQQSAELPTPRAAVQPSPSESGQQPVAQAPVRSEPVATAAAPSSPRDACGKRIFLAMAICMQEQCSSPRFNAHPQCVQMRQQQKEAQDRSLNGSN